MENKKKRYKVTCPGSHNWQWVEQDSNPGSTACFQSLVSLTNKLYGKLEKQGQIQFYKDNIRKINSVLYVISHNN